MRVLTPRGISGVAVVAFAADERDAIARCLRTIGGQPFVLQAARASTQAKALEPAFAEPPRLATLELDGASVDEVLVVDRGGAAEPDTSLELHLHGSLAVLDALRTVFEITPEPPLSAAEQLLRTALSPAQLDLALEQQELERRAVGAAVTTADTARYSALAAELTALAALPAARRHLALAALHERSRVALAHAEPCRLVLAGSQNAGKSTLFNRLLLRERALTGALPGLTRDPVDEATTFAGYPYELVDTAGEGPSESALDAEAIARGRALRPGSLVLLAIDGHRGPTAGDRALFDACDCPFVIVTKTDLPAAPWLDSALPRDFACAAASEDAAALRTRLGEVLRSRRGLPVAGPVGGIAALDRVGLAMLPPTAVVDESTGDTTGDPSPGRVDGSDPLP